MKRTVIPVIAVSLFQPLVAQDTERKDGDAVPLTEAKLHGDEVIATPYGMMAFTFGASASRYVNSRNLAVADANLIGSLHRMADYLPQANRNEARNSVREYLQVRIDAINTQDPADLQAGIQRSAKIQDELWTMAVTNRPDQDSIRANPFATALVKVIENDTQRQATALTNRLPKAIWITLGVLAILATALLGMSSGLHGRRSRIVATVFILAYTTVFLLIIDLDRPFRSIFRLSDPAAERVLQSMDRQAGPVPSNELH